MHNRSLCRYSAHRDANFHFEDGVVNLETQVKRSAIEAWIADELQQIGDCVDGLLKTCAVPPAQVDKVFLTGGSSFVPAVPRIFEERFGADRIQTGNEFTSVARGLALKALRS
jgi:hypothetical chaperone protein